MEQQKILAGYDPHGVVYEQEHCVMRKISSEYSDKIKDLFNIYQKNNLIDFGIVDTQLFEADAVSVTLKHKKYPITYPHEWSASMFKDAVLFHLNLVLKLEEYDLTLKDALPNNIVFDFTHPILVDFLSLVKKGDLKDEQWLNKVDRHEKDLQRIIFNKMFIPYFLIPATVMSRYDYKQARDLLYKRSCNVHSQPPSFIDLFKIQGKNSKIQNYYETIKLWWFLKKIKKKIFTATSLKHFVQELDMAPPRGDYIAYYEDKREDFSFSKMNEWEEKQKNVYKVLKEVNPKRVLDLGANTGWFSLLSAKNGAEVIATDIDESCIDYLYDYAKRECLKVLPLILPFEKLTESKFGFADATLKDRDFTKNPLFLPATDRLKSDVVLCLALIHHLILGSTCYDFNYVLKILAQLTKDTLILEFIELNDSAIQQDPAFFPNLRKHSKQTYNLDVLKSSAMNYFSSFELLQSHPDTRKLLILKK